MFPYAERIEKSAPDGLYDVPVQSVDYQIEMEDQSHEVVSNAESQRDTTALGLLASTYGNSSDSEEDQGEPDFPTCADETKLTNCSSESMYRLDNFGSPPMQDCPHSATGVLKNGSHRSSDCSVEFRTDDRTSSKSNGLEGISSDPMKVSHITSDCSPDAHDAEKTKFGKPIVPIENANLSLAPRSDEDSSRMHVFCLEHAIEVEKQLRPIGGVHILLLCHPGACSNNCSYIIWTFHP